MCMVDFSEGHAEYWVDWMRKAAKPHKCYECNRTIGKGEIHQQTNVKWSGERPDRYRTCLHCCIAGRWLIERCGGYLFGGVLEDLEQHWTDEGVHTFELGRLILGMRRRWLRVRGSQIGLLMPLKPAVVAALRTPRQECA